MRFLRYIVLAFLPFLAVPALGQEDREAVEVDYGSPKEYIVGDVRVEGNQYLSSRQILQVTGLQKGMKVTVPGDYFSSLVERLWLQKYFEDVSIYIDRLSEQQDSAFFVISIKERPRVSGWSYTGVRNGEKKDLDERIKIRRGTNFSEYTSSASVDIIKRYLKEKGFLKADVDVEVKLDRKGRTRLRLFSHSADEYSNYLDQTQRNGVGLSYKQEFNSFLDIFRKKKGKKQDVPATKAETPVVNEAETPLTKNQKD